MRQREVLYQVDFCLVMLKRSLARAGGQRTDDEAAVLHARIAELSATLDGCNAERSLFEAQIKKTDQDLGEGATAPLCRPALPFKLQNPVADVSKMLSECRACQKEGSRTDCTMQEFG